VLLIQAERPYKPVKLNNSCAQKRPGGGGPRIEWAGVIGAA